MKMNQNLVWIFALVIASGCATPKYGWRPAPEKTETQTKADITKCQRDSYMFSNGHNYFMRCMHQAGHTVEEIKEVPEK